MTWSLNARVIARVAGNPVVMIAALLAFVLVAYTVLPNGIKVLALIILALPIAACAFRLWKGAEQGGTDLEITHGGSRLVMTNIPLDITATVLSRGLNVFARYPLQRPSGIVKGTPANTANVIELESAGLPDTVEVAEKPVEPPKDAVALGPGQT